MKRILFSLLAFLVLNCEKYKEKDFEELEYLPFFPSEISIVVDEDSFHEFPTIIKFSSDQIIISRFQDSNEYETGYENDTIKILSNSFIEYEDYQITKFKTDYNTLKIRGSLDNDNVYYLEGIDPRKSLKLIGISDNLFDQIVNMKK